MTESNWLAFLRPDSQKQMPVAVRLIVAALTGAGLSLSYTGFYLSAYSWVCVGLLLIVIFGASARVAFACGFLHALLFVLTSVPWIAAVLSEHGNMPLLAGWGVLLLIAAAWGLLTGSFAWCVHRLRSRGIVWACASAPFFWVTFEFARAHLPEISFPWNLLGYPAGGNLGLVQLTTFTGIYGLSFLVAGFNAFLAWADGAATPSAGRRAAIFGIASLAMIALLLGGPRLVPKTAASHFARAVQPNFPEVMSYGADWFKEHREDMAELKELSLAPSASKTDLIVWPEAPAPFSWQDQNFAKLASEIAVRGEKPFLAGVIEWKQEPEAKSLVPFNSAIQLDPQGQRVFSYDKIHLVPFGEYEPFPLIHRVVQNVSSEVGGFRKGSRYAVGVLPNGYKFGVYICYEAIYAGEVRRFAANGAQLLVNISNDGWFGKSAAAEQHLRMARVRAVENRRWLLRVTNSGITAAVDPYGRVYSVLPRDTRAAADLPYDFRTDTTLYTRNGDWFAWLCVIISAILLGSTFLRKKA